MQVTITPIDDFIHDDIRFRRGVPAPIEEHVALEFEKRGLVRIVIPEAPVVPNVVADGLDEPPSSSPPDLPSPQRPVIKLKRPADETKHFE